MEMRMMTEGEAMHSAAVRRLSSTVLLTTEEIEFFEGLQNNRAQLKPDEKIIADGEEFTASFLIRKGWAMRWHVTPLGRRQIIKIYLPGDFIGLHVNFRRSAVHNVSALTNVELAAIEPTRILDIYRNYPILAAGLDWSAVRSFNIISEHNISLGARPARQRILHLFLELWCRMLLIEEADDDSFDFPLTQSQIADICGLSLVHTNKSIQHLRRSGLIVFGKGRLQFPDIDAAVEFCDFDARFLGEFRTKRPPHAVLASGTD